MADKVMQANPEEQSDCFEKMMNSTDKGESFAQIEEEGKRQEMGENVKRLSHTEPRMYHCIGLSDIQSSKSLSRDPFVVVNGVQQQPQVLTGEQALGKRGRECDAYDEFRVYYEPHRPRFDALSDLVLCYACISVKDLLGDRLKDVKSKVKIADFPRLKEKWGKTYELKILPLSLTYIHEGIGCDVTATTPHSEDMIALPRILFYAVIDEMQNTKLHDINEDVIQKWGYVMRDAKILGLDVKFAEEHLKKIAHAYFLSKGIENAGAEECVPLLRDIFERFDDDSSGKIDSEEVSLGSLEEDLKRVFCMYEAESFDEGAPLSKGILDDVASKGFEKGSSYTERISLGRGALVRDGGADATTPQVVSST